MSHNSARLLGSFFGVCGWGRVLVPVNFRLAEPEIRYIVEHSGADVLLVDPERKDLLDTIKVTPPDRARRRRRRDSTRTGVEPVAWAGVENATATINYTSGTTARPKGVQMTHRNLWINATVFGLHAGVNDNDVYLHTLPMFHANGWGMPFTVTGMGGKQIVLRKVDGPEILRRIERYGVTFMCAAPAVVNAVLDAAPHWSRGDSRPRHACASSWPGAPPATRTIERVRDELGWEFNQIYGLTETAPVLTVNRMRSEWADLEPRQQARNLGRAGTPGDRGSAEDRRVGRGAGPDQPQPARLLEQPGGDRPGPGRQLVPHRRRRLPCGRLPHHLRPEEGRHHHRRRERVVHRGRGRDQPAPGRGRGGRDRHPGRDVG